MSYDRYKAVEYAHMWAYKRNPAFYDFSNLGGDCTSFLSQCLNAGGLKMDYSKNGWFYKTADDRSASWTGVEFLYDYLIKNRGTGTFAEETDIKRIEQGDVVQLSFDPDRYSHSLIVVRTGADNKIPNNINNVLIAAHTYDSDNRPLSSYQMMKCRFLRIIQK